MHDLSRAEDVEAYLEQHEQKELLRFVAVGSVDDGKSTLIGRLLHDTKAIYEDQLASVQRASKRVGTTGGDIDFALLTDGLKAEREQGITIDVAYRYFSTAKRKFIIADTPGHVQYTRNMATGASTANVALILIDARHGVLQQSRRHAFIASLLGIPHLAVCINKMDLVDYAESAFDSIREEFSTFASGLRFKDVSFLPISAVAGDNVVAKSPATPWYRGTTLLEYLEAVPISRDQNLSELRFPVQYVLRPNLDYRGFCGQLASGVVRPGDDVVVLPSGQATKILAIDGYTGELDEAFAPMSVTIRLADEVDVSRGDVISCVDGRPEVTRRIEAHLVWMSEVPLDPERAYFLKHTTRTVRATVSRVAGKVDLETLNEVPTERFHLNDIGRVEILCNQHLMVDPYEQNRHTGAFVLIDELSNDTVAAGMIVRGFADDAHPLERRLASQISAERRAERLGQRGLAVCFAGVPHAGQSDVMYDLERRLFDMGHAACVIDVAALADGTRSPSLFADLGSQCVRAGMIVLYSTGLPRPSDRLRLREQLGPEQLLVVFADDAAPASVSASSESLHCALTVDERDRTISLLSKAIAARCKVVSDG